MNVGGVRPIILSMHTRREMIRGRLKIVVGGGCLCTILLWPVLGSVVSATILMAFGVVIPILSSLGVDGLDPHRLQVPGVLLDGRLGWRDLMMETVSIIQFISNNSVLAHPFILRQGTRSRRGHAEAGDTLRQGTLILILTAVARQACPRPAKKINLGCPHGLGILKTRCAALVAARWHLAANSDNHGFNGKVAVAKAGGIVAVIGALQQHPTHAGVQQRCLVLLRLAANADKKALQLQGRGSKSTSRRFKIIPATQACKCTDACC